MLNAEDYFAKRRSELGMEREEVLVRVQAVLDQWYPGKVRARSISNGLLKVVTSNATVAGELRLRQYELYQCSDGSVTKLVISIESI